MNEIENAAECLREGKLVAFPTETVYGLGADARNEAAVLRVFAVKGRPADHPLIVHLADAHQADEWAAEIPEAARCLMARFWPGPLTLVLPARDDVPRVITGGQDSVALRVPSHPVALSLLRAFGGGLAAPSANRFGAVSPTEAGHVHATLGSQIDLVLDGGSCSFGLESTIVSLLGPRPRVLRPGALPLSALREALGKDGIEFGALPMSAPRVPGALAAHYAPATVLEIHACEILAARAAVLLAQGLRVAVLRRDNGLQGQTALPMLTQFFLPAQPEDYARGLYARLRELDSFAFDRVLVEAPPDEEAWWAVNDRLARAAAGHARKLET
ncbi:MAG: L-threonylcarbamoyladenylate synthase [Sulfurimicrobium sp.]|nr:L-threonylcarbamoyladenylate synthase [Sulfurimicrobium sp.]